MIGKSEEKLRPKSIFWRRVIAKYVLWVEVAGYLLVIALFAGLVYAMTIKAEDEFLDIPGDINLAAEVLHAQGNAVVTSILPRAGRPAEKGAPLVELETSPLLVAKASLLSNLKKQLEFAQAQGQQKMVADIQAMIAEAEQANAVDPSRKAVGSDLDGAWYPTVAPGDVVTSGAVLGVVIAPSQTQIDIDTKAPNVSQKGKKLAADQPTTISVAAGAASFYMLGRMTEGGRKNPQAEVTQVPDAEADKLVEYLRQNPASEPVFPGANLKVWVGEKSWASLIWK